MPHAVAGTIRSTHCRGTFLDFQPTLFFGVPTVYVRLLETPAETAREIGAECDYSSPLRAAPAQVLEDFREKFGHTILERYGMTETLMNISNPYAGERRQAASAFLCRASRSE